MRVISFSNRQIKRMQKLYLSNKIVNTEGCLYLYSHKDKWEHLTELLKIYYNQDDNYISRKIYVITQLLANKDLIRMPELVLPNALASVNGNIVGFSMPYIENNVNMTLFLNNPKVNIDIKIKYLKEIYNILDNTMKIKELEGCFFLGDIHEANFILDINDQVIKAIDMDSTYINDSHIGISKYLTLNDNLLDNPLKYPHNKDELPIPNYNTTILCFVYMLLNALSGNKDSYKWSLNEFYSYLSFLNNSGVSKELLDCLFNVYSKSLVNNFNIEMLDSIDTKRDYTLTRARIPKTTNGYYYNV